MGQNGYQTSLLLWDLRRWTKKKRKKIGLHPNFNLIENHLKGKLNEHESLPNVMIEILWESS